MHVLTNLSEKNQKLLSSWILSYENNFVSLNERERLADEIINNLNDKDIRYELFNDFFRMGENVNDLIVGDIKKNLFVRINYEDFINVLINNLIFHKTNKKVKIVGKMIIKLDSKNNMVNVVEIEPRRDKKNPILMHSNIHYNNYNKIL